MRWAVRISTQVGGLYVLYALGSWIQRKLDLILPGSLVGMLLLFGLLAAGWIPESFLEEGANLLLAYLPLLFIPAVAGVVDQMAILEKYGVYLVGIVFVNTLLVMAVSSRVSQWLARWREERG